METTYNDDPLALLPSDHPGVQLINLKLNGQNFQRWSKSVRIALRTKGKLGFLDGSCSKPAVNSPQFHQWIRCDSMVLSWLLNSMIPELAEAFLYVDSTKELWSELTERFGDSNGHLHWKSPFEILHGKQPDMHTLRTVGCLCYAHNVGENDKFAPRATKCVLLGYTLGLKGYKLYDLQKNLSQQRCFSRDYFSFQNGSLVSGWPY